MWYSYGLQSVDKMWHHHKLFWIGVAVAAAFWLLEAAIHTWVLAGGTGLTQNLVPLDTNEWWMRTLVVLLIIAFGAYAEWEHHTLRRVEEERRAVQAELHDALTRVLSDFLPICAHCKAIREGERWVPVERYITGHTKTLFSHGLCPKCLLLYEASA